MEAAAAVALAFRREHGAELQRLIRPFFHLFCFDRGGAGRREPG
jgi:hypothetical protein